MSNYGQVRFRKPSVNSVECDVSGLVQKSGAGASPALQ